MPYNPGISYHGGEIIAAGAAQAAQNIFEGLKQRQEEKKRWASNIKLAEQFARNNKDLFQEQGMSPEDFAALSGDDKISAVGAYLEKLNAKGHQYAATQQQYMQENLEQTRTQRSAQRAMIDRLRTQGGTLTPEMVRSAATQTMLETGAADLGGLEERLTALSQRYVEPGTVETLPDAPGVALVHRGGGLPPVPMSIPRQQVPAPETPAQEAQRKYSEARTRKLEREEEAAKPGAIIPAEVRTKANTLRSEIQDLLELETAGAKTVPKWYLPRSMEPSVQDQLRAKQLALQSLLANYPALIKAMGLNRDQMGRLALPMLPQGFDLNKVPAGTGYIDPSGTPRWRSRVPDWFQPAP